MINITPLRMAVLLKIGSLTAIDGPSVRDSVLAASLGHPLPGVQNAIRALTKAGFVRESVRHVRLFKKGEDVYTACVSALGMNGTHSTEIKPVSQILRGT